VFFRNLLGGWDKIESQQLINYGDGAERALSPFLLFKALDQVCGLKSLPGRQLKVSAKTAMGV
jgi:hypothetical protein